MTNEQKIKKWLAELPNDLRKYIFYDPKFSPAPSIDHLPGWEGKRLRLEHALIEIREQIGAREETGDTFTDDLFPEERRETKDNTKRNSLYD